MSSAPTRHLARPWAARLALAAALLAAVGCGAGSSKMGSVAGGAGDLAPPSVPTGLAAMAASSTAVDLTWTASTDDVGVAGYRIYRDGAQIGTSAATAYADAGLAPAETYTYAVAAYDAAGNASAQSATASATTRAAPGPDTTPPAVELSAPAAGAPVRGTAVTVSADASDGGGLAGVQFLLDGASLGAEQTTSPWSITWNTTAAPDGPHQLSARARDAAGNTATAAARTVVVDNTPPAGSLVIDGGAAATNSLDATLTLAAADASTGVASMRFSSDGASWSAWEAYATTRAWTFTPGAGTRTVYAQFLDGAGNTSASASATIFLDTAAPTAPAGATATAQSPSRVLVSWSASSDDVGVTGYQVLRDGLLVGSTAASSFLDGGLLRGTPYGYTVRALDAAGNVSADSAIAHVVTPALAIGGVASASTTTTATISWITDVPATSQVHYGPTPSYGADTPADPTLTASHAVTITGLAPGALYHFSVDSSDATGAHVLSGDGTFTTASAGGPGNFVNEVLISGMNLPTAMKFLPNGDMLIAELGGKVWLVPAGTLQVAPAPFLTISNIGTLNGQQGLMDLALDPAYLLNHDYYAFYTLGSPNRDRVSRFTATADGTGTVPGSELVIYQDPLNANVEHHGGALNFGNDGKLYVTTGEHFNPDAAQSLASPRGKILRFNPDGTVPTDNPFYDGAGPNYDAIWALGLRNPYRAFYDPPTGRLYVGDVGGNDLNASFEELDVGVRGANYGWPICEGNSCASNPAYTGPIFAYSHAGRDAAITAGFVYRGSQFPPEYQGSFFYADYARNYIRRLTLDAGGAVTGDFPFEPPSGAADGPYGDIVYLTEGPDGALYYVDLGYSDTTFEFGVSKIRRIRFVSTNQPPVALASASPRVGPAPLSVAFSSAGSADPEGLPITSLWSFGDGATSTQANPVHVYGTNGPYQARLTVSDGNSSTLAAPIDIAVGNPPVPTITSPVDGSLFRAGDVIAIRGGATDLEEGVLPPAALVWNVDFLHEGHVHPGLPQVGTSSFSYTIASTGHDYSTFTRYRITLTATDGDGLQGSQAVLIFPDKVNLSFDTVPSGLTLTLDGIPHATPFVYDTLKGFQHTLGAPDQASGAASYAFASWSDGGARTHIIVVPDADAPYVATFFAR
jgi:glucose/arabinose dehydrogenase